MTELDKAWVAGLVDGEGSLALKRQIRKDVYITNYQVWVTVGMSERPENRGALEWLHKHYGGSLGVQKRKGAEAHRRDKIAWTVVSQDGLRFLKDVQPYLRIKKEQARLLIDFQENWKSRFGMKRDPVKKLKHEWFFYQLRELNTKGKLRLQRLSEKTLTREATV